jgi:hypothetical protein
MPMEIKGKLKMEKHGKFYKKSGLNFIIFPENTASNKTENCRPKSH